MKKMSKLSIGVIGAGTVGKATASAYANHVRTVLVYDLDSKKSTANLRNTVDSDLVFVCIHENELDKFFKEMHHQFGQVKLRAVRWIIRSTTSIGQTRELARKHLLNQVVHSPEFLTERTALIDAILPKQLLIGSVESEFIDDEYHIESLLLNLYEERFPGVSITLAEAEETEAIKLFLNSFFAVKIAFFNELKSLANSLNLDWETISTGMLADGRIAQQHTEVPGPDGLHGFGGKCLPKDLSTLIRLQLSQLDESTNDSIDSKCLISLAAHTRNRKIDRLKSAETSIEAEEINEEIDELL